MNINYNGKKFAGRFNSDTGEVGSDTIFEYFVKDGILKGSYSGGQISIGQLLGKVQSNSCLEFVYHHINNQGEIKTGRCHSRPEILEDGRIRLHESWEWLKGEQGQGTSIIDEI